MSPHAPPSLRCPLCLAAGLAPPPMEWRRVKLGAATARRARCSVAGCDYTEDYAPSEYADLVLEAWQRRRGGTA